MSGYLVELYAATAHLRAQRRVVWREHLEESSRRCSTRSLAALACWRCRPTDRASGRPPKQGAVAVRGGSGPVGH